MRRLTYLLTLVLVFALPWEDSISLPGIGSLARLMGFLAAAFWMATIVMEGEFRKPNLFHVLVLLFFLWNFVSLFWSSDIDNTMKRIKTYSQIFLLVLILWEIFQTHQELMTGFQAYILGGYVLMASVFYNYWAGNVAVKYEGRYSATGVNANDVALMIILGLPILVQLFSPTRRNVQGIPLRVINLLYVPLAIFTSILTGSRTILIAIIPFLAFMFGTQRIKFKYKLIIFVILMICFIAALPFIPSSVINRLGTIGSSISEGDLGGRVIMWQKSILVLAQNPILGVGSGAIDRTIGGAVHNTILSVAGETGFIGLALFLSILGFVVYELVIQPTKKTAVWLPLILTWAIGAMSLSWEFRKITWIVLIFFVIDIKVLQNVEESSGQVSLREGLGQSSSTRTVVP